MSRSRYAAPAPIVASAASAQAAPNTCQVGTVLRAVLLVHVHLAVIGLLVWPPTQEWASWWPRAGLVLGCSLPATLFWLVVTCSARSLLGRWAERKQFLACTLWGAVCGLLGGVFMGSVAGDHAVPWMGCVVLGALLAAELTAWLLWRARLQAPGDVAAQLAELQARIRPHFLFNALNSAIALVPIDPRRAEAVLEDLSDLFRHMLRDVRHSSTLGQELELAQRYLQVEQVRFGDRLRVAWELEPAANLAAMPALILQPLLENAIKHGVEPSPGGAAIKVRTELKGNVVRVFVTNTFPGGQGKPGNGMALDNVRRRLRLLHDVELQFSAKVVEDKFVVRIQVPMQVHVPTGFGSSQGGKA